MHSGGGKKLGVELIFIEAPQSEAIEIFDELYGRNPYHTSCNCCGPDYSIYECDSFEEASEYHRNGKYGQPNMTAEEFEKSGLCWVVRKEQITTLEFPVIEQKQIEGI